MQHNSARIKKENMDIHQTTAIKSDILHLILKYGQMAVKVMWEHFVAFKNNI